jgi:hypothetical protein
MPITKHGSYTDYDGSESSTLSDIDRVDVAGDSNGSVGSNENGNPLGLEESEGFIIQSSRILFFVFLMSSAAVLGWMVYLTVRNDQIEDFETEVRTVWFAICS